MINKKDFMLRIEDKIFSLDIIEKKFRCNLPACRGNCCRYGDSGAPLSMAEVRILDDIWSQIKPFLRLEGIRAIEESGTSIIDMENDIVTPLIGDMDCAYSVFNGNILMCGIEKAWAEGKSIIQKPLSCHLFPIRIKHYPGFTAVNYEELAICSGGREKGVADGIYVYEFLKDPLIRVFGEKIYGELCVAAEELRKKKSIE
jgi:hypothetical protein